VPSEPIRLKPDPACGVCHGRGRFNEYHGPGLSEPMDCECVFNSAPSDPATLAELDSGNYVIEVPPMPEIKEPEWPDDE